MAFNGSQAQKFLTMLNVRRCASCLVFNHVQMNPIASVLLLYLTMERMHNFRNSSFNQLIPPIP